MRYQNSNMFRIMSIFLTILFIGLLSASLTHAATENYSFVKQLGTRGTGYGQFQFPNAIAVDSSDNIYVADGVNCRIQKFDKDCNFITTWGSRGRNYGQFNEPYGIAVDSSGNIYTTEVWYQRVQKFDSNGNFITGWGSSGSENGQFLADRGIAVDYSGNVYVADSGNHRIQKFTGSGVYITQWGSSGSGNGQFYTPTDVAIDSSGNVYVADSGNSRIQKFDSNGKFITGWYTSGIDGGYFHNLNGVTVDSSGNVYAIDGFRIQKLTSNGKFIAKIDLDGASDLAAVDSSGNVYVTEHWSHCIKIYAPTKSVLPLANFTSNVTKGYAPLSVKFTDLSKNATSRRWNFGDGTNSTLQNPVHVYSKTGNFTVNLTAINANGTNSKTAIITVSAKPALPVANFTSNITSGIAPLNVAFTDKSTGTPTSWNWTFGDETYSTAKNVTHTYSKTGNYTVTLKVSNSAGSNTTAKTNYIKVTAVTRPVANFTSNVTSGTAPLTVSFTDRSTNTPTSWNWTFGDGTNSTSKNPIHRYSVKGNYTVSLTATNAAGSNTTTKISYIKVTSVTRPIANFSGNVTSGVAPLTVAFTDKSTNTPTSWRWTFGDGTNSTIKNPIHRYSTKGNYTVGLTAINTAGSNTTTKTNYIKVTAVVKPVANFTSNVTSGYAPFNVSFTDRSTNIPTSWKWTFGDGTNSTVKNPVHKYSTAGNYTVSLTASNSAGSNTTTKANYIKVLKR